MTPIEEKYYLESKAFILGHAADFVLSMQEADLLVKDNGELCDVKVTICNIIARKLAMEAKETLEIIE